jgi:hypothetical protein
MTGPEESMAQSDYSRPPADQSIDVTPKASEHS